MRRSEDTTPTLQAIITGESLSCPWLRPLKVLISFRALFGRVHHALAPPVPPPESQTEHLLTPLDSVIRASLESIYCCLTFSSCLITRKFASKKRSTQFLAHDSSDLSRPLFLIAPVMHLVQQMSVRLCTAVGMLARVRRECVFLAVVPAAPCGAGNAIGEGMGHGI